MTQKNENNNVQVLNEAELMNVAGGIGISASMISNALRGMRN